MSKLGVYLTKSFNALTGARSQTVEDICNHIKEIGRLPINPENLESKMKGVLGLMTKYADEIQVQWAACYAISNVSMNISAATMLMTKEAHSLVLQAVQKYGKEDWKICWLGCSAIWNLARPPSYRDKFTPACLECMLGVLFQYTYVPKVVNTALGAVSNLALQPEYKMVVSGYIDHILPIINQYAQESHICATAGGLLANLAVSDEVAEILVEKGALYSIAEMWKYNISDENFQRNTVAVLSNCLTATDFVNEILRYDLLEKLYEIHKESTNVSVTTLIVNCFQVLQVDPEFYTTSLHMCSHHGKYSLLKKKLAKMDNVDNFIDLKDGRNAPMLLYAAANNHTKVVELLIKCGANYSYLLSEDALEQKLRNVIISAGTEVEEVRQIYSEVIYVSTKHYKFPTDLSKIIGEYLAPFDMYKASNIFYE